MINWNIIEDDFYEKSCQKIIVTFEQNKEKIFYAVAFHQKYIDMEVFYASHLGMSVLNKEDNEDELEWSAPDWDFPELDIDVDSSMKDVLVEAKKIDTEKHWNSIEN